MENIHNEGRTILIARSPIEPGNVVYVRGRQALIESVVPSESGSSPTLARIRYIDDYQPNEETIIWEVEQDRNLVDARLIPDISSTPPTDGKIYRAYLNSLIWSSKLAFPKENFIFLTGPIWSSVLIHRYQLWPAYKAMLMPSVRLFIADDVGLGKTIEAGLVMQELIAQRSIRRILIICPASLQRQWQDEMREKFHQSFVIMDRDEISRIRQLDPNANPWTVHQKLIVSMDFLKRQEVLEEFESAANRIVSRGSGKLPWDLLIVDEVHNFAPLPGNRSTERIRMLEKVINYFEHRIFLSATPHNGFHYSYMGLLNLLDPVRFQKNIDPSADDDAHIRTVFIRRLKEDVNRDDPPKKFEIRDPPSALKSQPSEVEQRLFIALREYDREIRNLKYEDERERQALNFVRAIFKKRLLSSPYAFARTWYAHLSRIHGIKIDAGQRDLSGKERIITVLRKLQYDAEADMGDDRVREDIERDASTMSGELLSHFWETLSPVAEKITRILSYEMKLPKEIVISPNMDYKFDFPDCKFEKLISWLREYLGFDGTRFQLNERVIVFTEYCDTQDYLLKRLIDSGVSNDSILTVNGATDHKDVESIKQEFNNPHAKVRILLATDAAREGLNLQQTCRYVIHHDLPWNPLKIDQRVGRVDRHGQTRKVKSWHHVIETIEEYDFLSYIARKVEEARTDLGGLSPVLEESIESFFLSEYSQQKITDTYDEINSLIQKRRGSLATEIPDYNKIEVIEKHTRDNLEICEDYIRELLETALRLDGGSLEETNETDVYIAKLPSNWQFVTDSLKNPLTGALKKITFHRSLFVRNENQMTKWTERNDIAFLSLGHPVMRYAVDRLRRYVWHYRDKGSYPITKWTMDREPERCDRAVVSILKIARNKRGEVVHEEIEHVLFKRGVPSPQTIKNFVHFEHSCAGLPPDWHSELMIQLTNQIESKKQQFEEYIKGMLQERMKEDISLYQTWKERSLKMLEESVIEAKREKIEMLKREIAKLEEEKKQRRLDPIVEADIRLRLEQKNLELKDLKERVSERELSELKEHIEAEADRYIKEIFPARYTLDRVDVIVAGIVFTGE